MNTKNLSRFVAVSIACLSSSIAFAGSDGLEKMFQRIDANQDGILTVAELTERSTDSIKARAERKGWSEAVVAKRLENVTKRIAEEVKRLDTNEDEKITLAEFIAGKSAK